MTAFSATGSAWSRPSVGVHLSAIYSSPFRVALSIANIAHWWAPHSAAIYFIHMPVFAAMR